LDEAMNHQDAGFDTDAPSRMSTCRSRCGSDVMDHRRNGVQREAETQARGAVTGGDAKGSEEAGWWR